MGLSIPEPDFLLANAPYPNGRPAPTHVRWKPPIPFLGLALLISGSGKTQAGGHLVPRPAFQRAPGPFLLPAPVPQAQVYSTPLLEKERDSRPQALIADFGHPSRLERTRPRGRFDIFVGRKSAQPGV
jgi:hypothetical protein